MADITYKPEDGSVKLNIPLKEIKEILHEPLSKIKEISHEKNKENKIGLVIAIKTEEDEEKKRVENDLISELNNFLNSKSLTGVFNIIVLDKKEAIKVDNTNWEKVLRDRKCHLIIYGIAKKRKVKGADNYSLKLEAGVIHNPIPIFLSKLLSNEFAHLFPRERYFPVDDELLGFEVTAEWLGLSVEYMIGVAFFVSSNLGPSFLIFNDLQGKLIDISKSEDVEAVNQLKIKVPGRLVEVSLSICRFLYNVYAYKRDKNLIIEAKQYLDVIDKYNPQEKRMRSLTSIYYFLIEKNIDKAIDSQKDNEDPLRPYNLGFLYFMKEEISEGIRYYSRAFKRDVPQKALIDMESFITETLEEFKDKIQLYFSLGIINYRGKGDFSLALKDFKSLIKLSKGKPQYQELARLSQIYINELIKK